MARKPPAKPRAKGRPKQQAWIWGPDQERALETLQGCFAHGVAFDTETTGIDERAEIVEIAAVRICDGVKLYESYVCPVGKMQGDAFRTHRIPAAAYANAPEWPMVELEFLKAVEGYQLCAWSGQARNIEQFDRRMVNQSRQARGLPALQQQEWRVTNLKFPHYDYRINKYKATPTVEGQGGLARGLHIEGLTFSGTEHRAWVDADAEARLVQACCRPSEEQELAVAEAEISLMRRFRMRDPEFRMEYIEVDNREMRRYKADAVQAYKSSCEAAELGYTRLAKLWDDWAQESVSGLYVPTEDPVYAIDYSKAAPAAGAELIIPGAKVLMSAVAHWRFGQVAEVVQVLGKAPFETYKLRFADGDVLTYKPDCIERVATAEEARDNA